MEVTTDSSLDMKLLCMLRSRDLFSVSESTLSLNDIEQGRTELWAVRDRHFLRPQVHGELNFFEYPSGHRSSNELMVPILAAFPNVIPARMCFEASVVPYGVILDRARVLRFGLLGLVDDLNGPRGTAWGRRVEGGAGRA